MLFIGADERKGAYAVADAFSTRWVGLVYGVYSHRTGLFVCAVEESSERTVECPYTPISSDRFVLLTATVTEGSARYAVTAPPEPLGGLRWAIYSPGAKVLLSSVPIRSSLTYVDDRRAFGTSVDIGVRFACTKYWLYTDRKGTYRVPAAEVVGTSVITSTISTWSDRQVYCQVLALGSRRTVHTVFATESERQGFVSMGYPNLLSAVPVSLSLSEIATSRTVFCAKPVGSATYRWATLLPCPFSEKLAALRIMAADWRVAAVSTYRINRVDAFRLVLAKLGYTTRFCTTSAFVYASERMSFVEQRDLYYSVRPIYTDTKFSLYYAGTYRQLRFQTRRESEYRAEGRAYEIYDTRGAPTSWSLFVRAQKAVRVSGVQTDGGKWSAEDDVKLNLKSLVWIRYEVEFT